MTSGAGGLADRQAIGDAITTRPPRRSPRRPIRRLYRVRDLTVVTERPIGRVQR